MKSLFRCQVCGYLHEGGAPPEHCPKCGAPAAKFLKLEEDAVKKIAASDRTNDIHMEIVSLCTRMAALCGEGIGISLDPGCVDAFRKASGECRVIKERSKAEIAAHIAKGKW